jgi:hypothetical protein
MGARSVGRDRPNFDVGLKEPSKRFNPKPQWVAVRSQKIPPRFTQVSLRPPDEPERQLSRRTHQTVNAPTATARPKKASVSMLCNGQ